ncbi:MAG: hypothetical protein R3E01_33215 [Pirellulaceae bacterium]|nr:hypothetical protein [Planctomycetales bacterium]
MKRSGWLLAVAAICLSVAASAQAELKHRYSFTDNADDSVGGANGVVVDAGTTPNAVFSGGQLDLSANGTEGSNGIVEDAYVDTAQRDRIGCRKFRHQWCD